MSHSESIYLLDRRREDISCSKIKTFPEQAQTLTMPDIRGDSRVSGVCLYDGSSVPSKVSVSAFGAAP